MTGSEVEPEKEKARKKSLSFCEQFYLSTIVYLHQFIYLFIYFYFGFEFFLIFTQFLKVRLHLQSLQNIGYIATQYIGYICKW